MTNMQSPVTMLQNGVNAENLSDVVTAGIEFSWGDTYTAAPEGSEEAGEIGDAAEALFWFGIDCHGGQWSDEYRLQCVVGEFFRPGQCATGPKPETTAADWYAELCAAAGCDTD